MCVFFSLLLLLMLIPHALIISLLLSLPTKMLFLSHSLQIPFLSAVYLPVSSAPSPFFRSLCPFNPRRAVQESVERLLTFCDIEINNSKIKPNC